MVILSLLFFAAGILLLAFGVAIYKGNTYLIHDYHMKNVKAAQKREYARSIAKGLFGMCATCFIDGIIALLVKKGALAALLLVLAVGFTASVIALITAQRKYNGGVL